MQAKDIPDGRFLDLVAHVRRQYGRWTTTGDIARLRPDWPTKVVLAKARKLIRRNLLTGCHCGCRGDFELTVLGSRALTAATTGVPSDFVARHLPDVDLDPWQAELLDRAMDPYEPVIAEPWVPGEVWDVATRTPALVTPVSIADLDAWAWGRKRRTP